MLVQIKIKGETNTLIKLVKLSDERIPALLMTRYYGLALRRQVQLLNSGIDILFSFIDRTHGRFSVKMSLVDDERPSISLVA